MWMILAWKEFKDRKMKDVCEIAKADNIEVTLKRMMQFNASKQKTTSDYRGYDLTPILKKRGLDLVKVGPQIVEETIDEFEPKVEEPNLDLQPDTKDYAQNTGYTAKKVIMDEIDFVRPEPNLKNVINKPEDPNRVIPEPDGIALRKGK